MIIVKKIRVGAGGPGYEFEVWEDPPLIYLDHWAIRRLPKTQPSAAAS